MKYKLRQWECQYYMVSTVTVLGVDIGCICKWPDGTYGYSYVTSWINSAGYAPTKGGTKEDAIKALIYMKKEEMKKLYESFMGADFLEEEK